ncbi:hypothetical protein PGIGA_G00208300 [Pangasianodon gigas]|uniref:Uncharacterized protein n=1 Tax=Pangasianodon gigas TaxID=30993 RepID=A0ACC5WFH2_PANGG|nr:hypothetical protein [Pangasianodon gigas]
MIKSQWDHGSWRSLSLSCVGQPYSRSSRASEWECNSKHGCTAQRPLAIPTFYFLLLRNKGISLSTFGLI